ncbi:MAG: copper homeostasis membrane protein CopD [Alphaproteobacteria bacterium]
MTEIVLAVARFVHYASAITLFGSLFFAAVIAKPHPIDAALRRAAWTALPILALSGVLWFLAQAARMSGSPFANAFQSQLLLIVLRQTPFGFVFAARLVMAVAVALALMVRKSWTEWIALVGAALLLASLAWVGHAVGEEGVDHVIHLSTDVIHLLAAGAWLGSLPALALFFHCAVTAASPEWTEMARQATRRFSTMGLVTVGSLLATGIVNTWYLASSLPALVGTDYGRLLLVKIALFGVMVATAAVNRRVLTPRLATAPGDALRQLRRNSLIEAGLGILVIAIVAWLGNAVPGNHQQPVWAYPFRYSGDAFSEPEQRGALWLAITGVGFGLLVAAVGFAVRRLWGILAVLALAVAIFFIPAFRVLIVPAYPTSFFNSPTGYTAHSVAVGARSFAQNCAACHGPEGRGDGPLAKTLPIAPADLAAAHIYGHLPGDLFWWISNGVSGTPMPAFAQTVDEEKRWDLIDFILANADGTRAAQGTPAQAPDFAIQCPGGGAFGSLRASAGHIIHLVFAGADDMVRLANLRSLNFGADVITVVATNAPAVQDFCLAPGDDLAAAFALYLPDRNRGVAGAEFLIDGKGWLRDSWQTPPDAEMLRNAIETVRSQPVTVSPRPTGHHH